MLSMDISYLGHSSFKLKGKDVTLITDPFDPSIGLKFPKVSADLVTVSHDHDDHNKAELVKDAKRVISGPGEYDVQGVSIIGMATYHDDEKGKLRGRNTVYLIEIDGVKVVHLGDLGHELTEKQVEYLGEVNVLFIPVGGHYTVGSDVAVKIAQNIEANITIPMHYQTAGLDPNTFKDLEGYEEFAKKMELPVEVMDKLSVKPDSFGEEQKIVVLKN